MDLLYPLIPKWVPLNNVKMFARPRKFGFIQDNAHKIDIILGTLKKDMSIRLIYQKQGIILCTEDQKNNIRFSLLKRNIYARQKKATFSSPPTLPSLGHLQPPKKTIKTID